MWSTSSYLAKQRRDIGRAAGHLLEHRGCCTPSVGTSLALHAALPRNSLRELLTLPGGGLFCLSNGARRSGAEEVGGLKELQTTRSRNCHHFHVFAPRHTFARLEGARRMHLAQIRFAASKDIAESGQ